MSAMLAKKLLNLIALISDVVEGIVGCVDQQNDLNRRLGDALADRSICRAKEKYRLRFLVIEQSEIVLLKTRDRPSRGIGYKNIELDLAFGRTWRRTMKELRVVLIRSLGALGGIRRPGHRTLLWESDRGDT